MTTCQHCGAPTTPGPVATIPHVHLDGRGRPHRQACDPAATTTPGSVAAPRKDTK